MEALEREAGQSSIEAEERLASHQRDGAAGAVNSFRTCAGRAREVDLLDEDPRAVLLPEQNDAGHGEVEVGGPERARPARCGPWILACPDEIDVPAAVDLASAKEEGVDPALAGAVEQLDGAVGEEVVLDGPRMEMRTGGAPACLFCARSSIAPAAGIGEAAPTATCRTPSRSRAIVAIRISRGWISITAAAPSRSAIRTKHVPCSR